MESNKPHHTYVYVYVLSTFKNVFIRRVIKPEFKKPVLNDESRCFQSTFFL